MLLKEGYTGPQVEQLQSAIGLRADGYYNEKTTRAVRAWQQANGLPITGDVDQTMWDMLFPPPPIVEQPVTVEVEPIQPTTKPIEDGHKQDQTVTPEVDRILSGGSHKNTNRSSSHSG